MNNSREPSTAPTLGSVDVGKMDFSKEREGTPTEGAKERFDELKSEDRARPAIYAKPLRPDGLSPHTFQYNSDAELPPHVTKVAKNKEGFNVAIDHDAYTPDVHYFNSLHKTPDFPIDVKNAARGDRAVSVGLGLGYVPSDIFQPMAVTPSGRQVQSTLGAINNGDQSAGVKSVNSTAAVLVSLGVSDPKFQQGMTDLTRITSDPASVKAVDDIAHEGSASISNKILTTLTGGIPSTETDHGKQLIAGAGRLGQVWSNLSPAQKSLSFSALTKQTLQETHGVDTAGYEIPGTKNAIGGPLTTKDATKMISNGLNGFGVARNWSQLSALAHSVGIEGANKESIAQFASDFGLVGVGPQDGAVDFSEADMTRLNSRPMPAFGIGAIAVGRGMTPPKGFKLATVTPDGMDVLVPEAHLKTSPFSSTQAAPMAYKNAVAITENKHPAQRLWGKSPTRGIVKGSAGGSGLLAGVSAMAETSPSKWSAMTAYSLFNETHGHDSDHLPGDKEGGANKNHPKPVKRDLGRIAISE